MGTSELVVTAILVLSFVAFIIALRMHSKRHAPDEAGETGTDRDA